MDILKKLINRHNIVSFDIFDTLILRMYNEPHDLFYHMENCLNEKDFAKKRIEAERSARMENKKHGLEEVTLEDIYRILKDERARNLEISLELASCKPNFEILSLYKYACELKKIILITSDMYLPRDVIEEILKKNEIIEYNKLYISSEDFFTKISGSRYEKIKNEWCIDNAKKILHVGDNKYGDVKKAQDSGLNAYWYISPREQGLINKYISKEYYKEYDKCSYIYKSLMKGAICFNTKRMESKDYWYWMGYVYVGSILLAFSDWLLQNLKSKKCNNVFFLARDGQIMKNFFDVIKPEYIRTHYMPASRRCLILPSLDIINNEQDIEFFKIAYGFKKPIEYWTRLGISNDHIYKNFLEYFPDPYIETNKIEHFKDKINEFFDKNKSELQKIIDEECFILKEYCHVNGLGEDSIAAVVDIGWRGNMQYALNRILKKFNKTGRVIGYYLGTYNIKEDIEANGYLIDHGYPENLGQAIDCDILETFFLANHTSVINIKKDNKNNFIPILQESNHEEDSRIAIAKKVQSGVMDYIHDILELYKITGKFFEDNDIRNMLIQFLINPSNTDVHHLNQIKHATDMGVSISYRPLLQNRWKYIKKEISSNNKFYKIIYKIKKNYHKVRRFLLNKN